jgi:hypothetical protein
MLIVSGSRPHSLISSLIAAASRAARSAPSRAAIISRASAVVSGPRVTSSAHSVATRPVSVHRLVTSTAQPELAGSSGRTCRAARALSSTMSTFCWASRLRYRPIRASTLPGTCGAGTPSACSSVWTACPAGMGEPDGSKPRRSR